MPDKELLESAQKQFIEFRRSTQDDYYLCHQPATTRDERHIEVAANIGSEEDTLTGKENGADGIGLLRTEFIYLKRNDPPSEEEQVEIYSKIFTVMGKLPIVARTFDIGGDKEVPYLGITQEKNPFLGFRAIRFCLSNPKLFRSQLRALLRTVDSN